MASFSPADMYCACMVSVTNWTHNYQFAWDIEWDTVVLEKYYPFDSPWSHVEFRWPYGIVAPATGYYSIWGNTMGVADTATLESYVGSMLEAETVLFVYNNGPYPTYEQMYASDSFFSLAVGATKNKVAFPTLHHTALLAKGAVITIQTSFWGDSAFRSAVVSAGTTWSAQIYAQLVGFDEGIVNTETIFY